MKTVAYAPSHQVRTLPRGLRILGFAIASWALVLLVGAGLVNLFQLISSAV